MPNPRGSLAPVPDDASGRSRLASWYAQGMSDGLGDRLLMFDNAATGPLEVLRVRPDFALVPDFETRLRLRFDRLAGFTHAGFAPARGIEHLDNGEGLTVISSHVPGTRLSELFRSTRPHGGMHPASARWAMRELTGAMAALHREARDIAHGALGPDRIVITADRHLVITDYLFADALEHMKIPPERLWGELGVVAVDAPARLDQRSDVVQLALVVISLVIGRRVPPAEYPANLPRLLDEFSATASRRSADLMRPLIEWLEAALSPNGFRSAVEAEEAMMEATALPTGSAPLRAAEPRPMEPLPMEPQSLELEAAEPRAPAQVALTSQPPRLAPAIVAAALPAPDVPGEPTRDAADADEWAEPARMSRWAWVAAGLAALVVLQGGAIGWLASRTSNQAPRRITIESSTPGDQVWVGGTQVGVTPLEVNVSDTAAVRVVSQPAAPPAGAVIAMSQPGAVVDPPDAPAAAPAVRTGGVQIVAPIPLQVVEGDRVLGSAANGPIVVGAGTHEFDLINNALAFRTRQSVRVVAGRVVQLRIDPPDGAISVNAQPWAQVFIDGRAVGDTPLANLPLALGEHEIVFRHPQLGERRQRAVVQAGSLTRVSATFTP